MDNSPPILKIMEKDPASQRSFEIASRWLKNCVESHSSCKPPIGFQKPPRRLIHVGNKTQNPFLVETSPDLQHAEWLTLSYCWGEEPSMKLTDDTMNALKNGIPLGNFDATIQDAILVTRALGISYIWIDGLCILQDHDEFREEASKMNEIYGGSTVVLVIASSDSVKNGFLKERDLNYIPVAYSTDPAEDHRAKLFVSPEWDDSEREYNGPWSNRGWTMQEGLLPNRLLHYTASQIIWKCCEEQIFERGVVERVEDRISETLTYSDYGDIAFGSGLLWKLPTFLRFKRFKAHLPTSLDYPLMSHSETFRLWYDVVEEYTQRKFTNISDRLVAISSLARIYGNMIRNPTYVAGLWKEDLIRGLLWHVEGATLIPRGSADDILSSHEAFPSWTWAGVGYEAVKNDLKTDNSLCALSELEDIQIDLVHPRDPFGAVKSGSVTIAGPLRRLPRLYNKEWTSEKASMSKLERYISGIIDEENQGSVAHKYSSPPGDHFSVLQMLKGTGLLHLLVLEATGDILNGINVYRRAGILELRYIDPSSYASPELIATMKKMETSITARLGPRKEPRTVRMTPNAVFMEVERGNWVKETVMII
ncbi:HET-domain-containing protein [Cadophora sp. DSE1049]|nr:HET-domain-containing protein [Cadophora sp. DSE1049]